MGSVVRVERDPPGLTWHALAGDRAIGSARAWVRPDDRCWISLQSTREDVYEPLLTAVANELPCDLYVTVDEVDGEALSRYALAGFVVNRRESHYLIPTDPALSGLGGVDVPPGFLLVDADEVEEGRLRVLDDTLRQDVPGTDGWAWDAAGFREELAQPSFDPATYLIAVEERTGTCVGIARVWNNPAGPRLGFVGVLPAYRRRGIARALLARAFAVLDERGQHEVSTEIDDENVPSRSLLEPLGVKRTGGSIELIRRRPESS